MTIADIVEVVSKYAERMKKWLHMESGSSEFRSSEEFVGEGIGPERLREEGLIFDLEKPVPPPSIGMTP